MIHDATSVLVKRLRMSTSVHIEEDSRIPSDCTLHKSFPLLNTICRLSPSHTNIRIYLQ